MVVGYFMTLSLLQITASNCVMKNGWWLEKYLKRSCRGLIVMLSRYALGLTETNRENRNQGMGEVWDILGIYMFSGFSLWSHGVWASSYGSYIWRNDTGECFSPSSLIFPTNHRFTIALCSSLLARPEQAAHYHYFGHRDGWFTEQARKAVIF
jgi:hypothetical protein